MSDYTFRERAITLTIFAQDQHCGVECTGLRLGQLSGDYRCAIFDEPLKKDREGSLLRLAFCCNAEDVKLV